MSDPKAIEDCAAYEVLGIESREFWFGGSCESEDIASVAYQIWVRLGRKSISKKSARRLCMDAIRSLRGRRGSARHAANESIRLSGDFDSYELTTETPPIEELIDKQRDVSLWMDRGGKHWESQDEKRRR